MRGRPRCRRRRSRGRCRRRGRGDGDTWKTLIATVSILGSRCPPLPPRRRGDADHCCPPCPYHRRRKCRRQPARSRAPAAVRNAVANRSPAPAGVADDLLLKVTPPRVPRHQIARPRLQSDHERLRDHPVILVQAPAGYGKTSLLAQWRREHLAQGRVVAWLSAQQADDVARFVQILALAIRAAAGRPTFGHTLLEATPPSGLEGVTVWLAEITQSALDVVLIVDEADRLPAASREALAYLLRNAPANLRAVVAARADCHFDIDDLITYGTATRIGATDLAFRLDETLELVRGRFGSRVDRDAAARLHELAEGWPLGLQLALSVMAAGGDPQAEVSVPSTQAGVLHDRFVNLLLANLDAADVAFLTRISILDLLHAELCGTVAQVAAAGANEWLRMHALARDELRRRFALLPADEQAALHGRAAEALAGEGLFEA